MAGQLDTALKNIAKQVVAQLGDSLDTTIVYTRKEYRAITIQLENT